MSCPNSYLLLSAPLGDLTIQELPTYPLEAPEEQLDSSHSRQAIKLSLIIPTFNEAGNIFKIIKLLTESLEKLIPNQYELILVDDDSPDQTWKIAQSLLPDYPMLKVIRRVGEKGLSTAVIRGWQVSQGEILGVIDADLQHPPESLISLWQQIERGADLAVASRHVEEGGVSDWSFARRILSRGAQVLGLIILPGVIGRVSDPMSGYFLIRRACLLGIKLNPVGYKILIEVLGRGSVRWVGEVGYVFQERQEEESKVTWRQYVEYIQHLLTLRFSLWPVQRFLRFGAVGFSGVFVDMSIFYVLREILQMGLTRSAVLSSEVAIISNFILNDIWTFGDISRKQKGANQRFKRFLKFNLICLAGLILNVLIVNFLFNILGVNEYLAKLIAIATVTLWNFWVNLKLSWRVTATQSNPK